MELNFCGENGRVQAVVQDVRTNKVLRVGYLNAATLKQMEAEKVVKLLNQQNDEAYVVTGGEYNKPLELDNMQANEDGSAVLSLSMWLSRLRDVK